MLSVISIPIHSNSIIFTEYSPLIAFLVFLWHSARDIYMEMLPLQSMQRSLHIMYHSIYCRCCVTDSAMSGIHEERPLDGHHENPTYNMISQTLVVWSPENSNWPSIETPIFCISTSAQQLFNVVVFSKKVLIAGESCMKPDKVSWKATTKGCVNTQWRKWTEQEHERPLKHYCMSSIG